MLYHTAPMHRSRIPPLKRRKRGEVLLGERPGPEDTWDSWEGFHWAGWFSWPLLVGRGSVLFGLPALLDLFEVFDSVTNLVDFCRIEL